jgi:hypothetical protein
MRNAALATLVIASLAIASVAAAGSAWTTHRDQANHFRIAAPSQWVIIPGSRAAATKLATSLEKQNKVRQATLVRSYLADNYQSGENRILDGVQYPIQTSPILTDFFLVKDELPSGLKSNSNTLNLIGDALFSGFVKQPGVHMTTRKPVHLKLPAGEAVLFSGTVPADGFGGRSTGFAFYSLLGNGKDEWQIEFRTDSRSLSRDGALFRRIADSFALQ